jgi:hypothetical protein
MIILLPLAAEERGKLFAKPPRVDCVSVARFFFVRKFIVAREVAPSPANGKSNEQAIAEHFGRANFPFKVNRDFDHHCTIREIRVRKFLFVGTTKYII